MTALACPIEVPMTQPVQHHPRPQDVERWRANTLAEALWGIAHGIRDWESIPTRPHTQPAFLADAKVTASVPQPQRLLVRVPGLPQIGIITHDIVLYRKDYDALLEEWGYTALKAAEAIRARHEARQGKRGQGVDMERLLSIVESGRIRHPALALAWAGYLASARLAAVFTYHPHSRTVQVAARQNGDLRECVLQLRDYARVLS